MIKLHGRWILCCMHAVEVEGVAGAVWTSIYVTNRYFSEKKTTDDELYSFYSTTYTCNTLFSRHRNMLSWRKWELEINKKKNSSMACFEHLHHFDMFIRQPRAIVLDDVWHNDTNTNTNTQIYIYGAWQDSRIAMVSTVCVLCAAIIASPCVRVCVCLCVNRMRMGWYT